MPTKQELERLQVYKSIYVDSNELDGIVLADLGKKLEYWIQETGPDAKLEIDYDYDGYFSFSVEWYRSETDQEYNERIEGIKAVERQKRQEQKARREQKKEQEKRDLAKLVKQYPDLAKELISK
jgi:hypothetical protein